MTKLTLSTSALCAALLAFTAMPAEAQDELGLAHFMPPAHTLHTEVFVPLQDKIAKATDGKIALRIYPAGELGAGPNQQYDRALRGVADMVFGLPGYTSSTFPRTLLLELPGALPDAQEAVDMIWDNIDQFAPDFERVELLGLWTATPTLIATRGKPVRSLKDLEGMTIRAPSVLGAEFLAEWGANPVNIPASDLYTSLETGVIDGVMTGPDGIRSFRLYEVLDYITRDFPGGVSTFYVIANKDQWAALPEEQRAELEALFGRTISADGQAAYRWAADEAYKLFDTVDGLEVITLDEGEAGRIIEAIEPQIAAYKSQLKKSGIDAEAILSALEE
ncbi:TRAP transporter substrate-binding protein [Nitratireductor kimnyeongensis]|uniref:TRAP transporter substrate-binding protein n=1 Tax=Nitratireductor kimnyeongensis TaxID=430679 RepID=A0ABW0T9C0_9HYPH|nr:TRAP transporter substrate-binding protein [Nitratireductor kimnyeongensis]QZZ36164.1 TRAP transporter substrate-binding protein [Nitratireductor kimnyeongensis]